MSQSAAPSSIRVPSLAEIVWPARTGGMPAAVRYAVLAVLGTCFLTLSAKVFVPLPLVPITLQTLAVLMIGAAYGSRLGAATVALYLLEGVMGLPVFAEAPAKGLGLGYLMGPTGGYLVGFVFAAAVVGFLAERGWDRSMTRLFVAMGIGHLVILAMGYGWLATLVGPQKAWVAGILPFIAGTLVKNALGAALVPQIMRVADRYRR